MFKRLMAGMYALAFFAVPIMWRDNWLALWACIPGAMLATYTALGRFD